MTRVDLSAVAREFGDVPVDAVATVRVQGWAGARPAATVDGAAVVFSPRNEVIVQGGTPGQAIDLVPTDGTFCYRWDVSMRSGSLKLPTRYTLVPTSGPVAFGDLVDVDPESFEPTEDAVTAWEAAIETAEGLVAGIPAAVDAEIDARLDDLVGPEGPQGPAGPQGATGPQGDAGPAPTPQSYADAITEYGPARSALRAAYVTVQTSDGQQLPQGTVVVITIDKTLAQVTASPVADIADITFQTGA
jgi:hypothetical protein